MEGGLEDDKVNRIFLERAAKAIDRMTHILEDLDELTKLEVNELKLEIRPFDIRDLAREVIESFEMKTLEKGISVTLFERIQQCYHGKSRPWENCTGFH